MALASLKNVEVTRMNNTGNGFSVAEEYKTRDGSMRRTYWKIWPNEPAGVSTGDRVNVSGFLSAKTTEPRDDGKVFVDLSLNQPRIERLSGSESVGDASTGAHVAAPVSGAQTGAEGFTTYSDEVPF